LAGLAVSALFTTAQAAPPALDAATLWQLQRVGSPALTPDGKFTIATLTRYDVELNKGQTDLWRIPTAGGAAEQLTSDPASESEPEVSPDGRWVLFSAKRDEDKAAQLYVLPLAGGEARRLTNVPTGAGSAKWFTDSRRIAFLSAVWPDLPDFAAQGKRLKEREDSKMSGRVYERAPVTYWDHFLNDRETHVWVTTLEGRTPTSPTLAARRALPPQDPGAGSYDISPDGKELAFVADTDATGIQSNADVFVVPMADESSNAGAPATPVVATNLTPGNPADDANPLYSPDGQWLAYTRKAIPTFYADTQKLVLRSRKDGTTRTLAANFDRSADGLVWTPDAKALYGSIDDAATRRVYRFDVATGAAMPLTRAGDFAGLALAGKPAVLVATRQSFSEPPALVRVDLKTGDTARLSAFNDALLGGVSMGKVESVTYAGANSDPIQMWVVYPPGFDPAKKYPLFLLLHGGPHNGITDAWTYRWNAQVFAGWGYVVAWHNFHGSSGFGQQFTDSINPDQATLPYGDTIKATEWFMAQPWIDTERMVAGGGSYGGYLATTLLGREHPFKALIAHAAVYNEYTQIGSDYGAEKARFYQYWEKPAEFQANSPHMAAANFKTPTLVIHGQLDQRVPVNHGLELFNTLQTKGIPSKFVYFPDENHWVLKPQNSLFWYEQVKDWVTHYAAPGAR
jgi:dipeptidyl aminopeptidase/acylaminoacyl peptidase